MNVEALLKTADLVENDDHPWNMFEYSTCIMPRAAVSVNPSWTYPVWLSSEGLRKRLGLSRKQADALFFDWPETMTITRRKAAIVIRNLVETGVVDWEIGGWSS